MNPAQVHRQTLPQVRPESARSLAAGSAPACNWTSVYVCPVAARSLPTPQIAPRSDVFSPHCLDKEFKAAVWMARTVLCTSIPQHNIQFVFSVDHCPRFPFHGRPGLRNRALRYTLSVHSLRTNNCCLDKQAETYSKANLGKIDKRCERL